MTPAEKAELLRGLAERLARALMAERFAARPGYAVGTDLVAANIVAPEAFGRTVGLIHARLLADLGLAGEQAQRRLADLLDALAAGYARALRARTLDEQEAIRSAALAARVQAEKELRHALVRDRLTGLPNRMLITQRLEEALTEPSPTARMGLCFIGLDGFQAINDSLGHHVGDQVLVVVAQRLDQLTAEAGQLLARLGGDEFAILVENTTCADEAVKCADRALAVLGAPIAVDGHQLTVTASAGVVERPMAGTDPTELMRAADIALHWAKADSTASWAIFDADRSARHVTRYRLSAAMPAALDRGEFTLAYQPLVDLANGAIRGAEALARWRHPQLGTLGHNRFIGLAESTGLIVALGRLLLEQACRQAATWRALTPRPPFVSVNLAVLQLRHPGLAGDVAAALDSAGLPAHRLQLEITESAVLGADGDAETLHDLARLGVRLAIDDFGTGYSNLTYLGAIPVHGLKLASGFVRRVGSPATTTPDAKAVLAALVNLGHTLGLTVTAEGIETADQARHLAAIGCDTGQGWHFGRPATPAHIARLISRDGAQ
jgi:diguanylate cyclase (GGDEF)-like protein